MIVGAGSGLEEGGVHATLNVVGKGGGRAGGHSSTREKSKKTRWRCWKDVKGVERGSKGGLRAGRKEKVENVSRARTREVNQPAPPECINWVSRAMGMGYDPYMYEEAPCMDDRR